MSKSFHLQSKLGIDNGSIVSIINPYVDGAFPYWISNSTGARISKVKAMAGMVKAGTTGGSVVVKIYHKDAIPITGGDVSVHGITRDAIADEWEYLTEIDYSATDVEMQYGVDYRIVDINLTKPSFILGIVEVVGDIKVENLFVWINYDDNIL